MKKEHTDLDGESKVRILPLPESIETEITCEDE